MSDHADKLILCEGKMNGWIRDDDHFSDAGKKVEDKNDQN